jgi:hypothetical protein
MKKIKLALITALSLALWMGCKWDSDSDPESDQDTSPAAATGQELRFQATINQAQGRAAGTAWTAGDAIGVFMLEREGSGIVGDASNRKFVSDTGNGVFDPAKGVEKISVQEPVNFTAYYPYTGAMDGFSYPVDVSAQANQEAIDLLTAERTPADKDASVVPLNFKHRLSAVELKIRAGENVKETELKGLTAEMTGQTLKGWFDISANQLAPSTDASDRNKALSFKMSLDGKSGSAVILPAAGGTARTVKITIKTGNNKKVTFTKKIPDTYEFLPGVRHQFPITLYRASPAAPADNIGAEGGFDGTEATIQDWEVKVEQDTGLTPGGGPEIPITTPDTPMPTVTKVSVDPEKISVVKGETQSFAASVEGTNEPPQTVNWSVSGGKTGTGISDTGLLTVAADESAPTLTVKAVSALDTAKSGEATVTVTAPASGKSLSSIAIAAPPAKTAYTVGDSLDTAGLVVKATYSDGSTKTVTDYTASSIAGSAPGTKTVTVSYTEGGITKAATFTVTINPPVLTAIAIAAPPTKTTYTVGEPLSAAGMVVKATYSDDSTKTVTDFTTKGFNSSAAGTKTVTVS